MLVSEAANEIEERALSYIAAQICAPRVKPDASRRRWYLLQVEPRSEHIVGGHLNGHCIRNYGPVMPEWKPVFYRSMLTGQRHQCGRKRVLVQMFPGYRFALLDLAAEWSKVRSRPGVIRVIESPDGPCVISDLLITQIVEKERELCNIEDKPAHSFRIGQEVRVVEGAFAGFVATIERLDGGERIRLLLDLFGRKTPVSQHAHEIEAI